MLQTMPRNRIPMGITEAQVCVSWHKLEETVALQFAPQEEVLYNGIISRSQIRGRLRREEICLGSRSLKESLALQLDLERDTGYVVIE